MDIHKGKAVGLSQFQRFHELSSSLYQSGNERPEPYDARAIKLIASAHRLYQVPVIGALERNFMHYALNGFYPRSLLGMSIKIASL